MKVFIFAIAVALVIAGVASEEHGRFRRGVACRCDSDGPRARGNNLSGTSFFFVGCHSGFKKCASYTNAVTTCCKE
ncbi:toxin AnmTx Cj 1c-1-like isoform X2 [Tubulanus polymorphus]|uniref:toxin AnmTx Cj 1c-1-like isoform X2 n=1 Tax=Tubulanus polymorphus TaxID=672921 RepID=UPI003DA6ABD4